MQRTDKNRNRVETRGQGAGASSDAAETEPTTQPLTTANYDGEVIDGEYADGDTIGLTLDAGKRGSGKTFLQWEKASLCRRRVVIFDTLDQYTSAKGYALRGWIIVHQPGELRALLAKNLNADKLRVIYKPLSGDKEIHFRAATRLVLDYGKKSKGVIYFVDEVDKFCGPNEPLKTKCPPLYDLVEYGRHFKVSGGFTTRRPHSVSRSLTAQCGRLIIFRSTEPRDLKYFEEFIGSAVKHLPRLGKYQYLLYVDDAHVEPQILGGRKKRAAIRDKEPPQS